MIKSKPLRTLFFLVSILAIAAIGYYLLSTKRSDTSQTTTNSNIERTENAPIIKKLSSSDKVFQDLAGEAILLDTLTKVSPDGLYAAYVTVENLGLSKAKLWLYSLDQEKSFLIDAQNADIQDESNAYFAAVDWNSDSSEFAYLKIYPTEIFLIDIDGVIANNPSEEWRELLITKRDGKDNNTLNPSIGYQGGSYLKWQDNMIVFENTLTTPATLYSIDLATKEVLEFSKRNEIMQAKGSDLNFFSQRDSSWVKDQLGGCAKQTIGSAGCAITSMAMVLSDMGFVSSASDLNDLLSRNDNQGYVFGCDIKWYAIPTLIEGLSMKGAYDNKNGMERIDYELELGNYVIMGFRKVTQTGLQHWVVITGKKDGKFLLKDPWELEYKEKTLDDFGGSFDYLVVYEKE